MEKQNNMASIISELEDIHVRLTCGSDMLFTLHTAMLEGTLTPKVMRNSLWGIADYIDELIKAMGKQVDAAGDTLLEARKGGAEQ